MCLNNDLDFDVFTVFLYQFHEKFCVTQIHNNKNVCEINYHDEIVIIIMIIINKLLIAIESLSKSNQSNGKIYFNVANIVVVYSVVVIIHIGFVSIIKFNLLLI